MVETSNRRVCASHPFDNVSGHTMPFCAASVVAPCERHPSGFWLPHSNVATCQQKRMRKPDLKLGERQVVSAFLRDVWTFRPRTGREQVWFRRLDTLPTKPGTGRCAIALGNKRSTNQAAPRPGTGASLVPAPETFASKSKPMRNAWCIPSFLRGKASDRTLEGLALIFLCAAIWNWFHPQTKSVTITTRIGSKVLSSMTTTNDWVQIQWHTNYPHVWHTWKTNKLTP